MLGAAFVRGHGAPTPKHCPGLIEQIWKTKKDYPSLKSLGSEKGAQKQSPELLKTIELNREAQNLPMIARNN